VTAGTIEEEEPGSRCPRKELRRQMAWSRRTRNDEMRASILQGYR